MFFQAFVSSQTIKPDSTVAEYPSWQERLNSVPDGLDEVGEMLAECSMLNGPLHILAEKASDSCMHILKYYPR